MINPMMYTRKGDTGTTTLLNLKKGERIKKCSLIFDALGNIDELNCVLGHAKTLTRNASVSVYIKKEKVQYEDIITKFQEALFCIQAELGGSTISINKNHILFLEEIIQEIETVLPPVTSFVIPGGGKSGTYLDIARTVARRTERSLVSLFKDNKKNETEKNIAYINRLSSALYILARFANYQSGYIEHEPEYT